MDKTIEKNGKVLRYGYTTGSCATAATKAALLMFLRQEKQEEVAISTPKGWALNLRVHDQTYDDKGASCAVVKDAGDDPDITNGLKIFSKISPTKKPGICFVAGVGVGQVTAKGLSIPPGQPAINPVPRLMMETVVNEVLQALGKREDACGWRIEIAIPQGEALAKRTFNPKLGIKGGLSIIGTSGIVEPMSEEALKATLKLELAVLRAKEAAQLIFVPGNYGKDFSERLGLPQEMVIKTSNYIGFMLDEAERLGIKKILMVGHLGKLVKVAGGIFNTHSNVADGRMEILAAHAGILGATQAEMVAIMAAKTTDEAADLLRRRPDYFNHLAQVVKEKARDRVDQTIDIETILFSQIHGFLGQSEGAEKMREGLCIG